MKTIALITFYLVIHIKEGLSRVKCSSFGKFRFRNPSNISTESILVRVRRMYAVNHGITLRVVSDELPSRGQDRCRHTSEGSQPPKAAGSLSCAIEGHDTQKSVTTLGRCTYHQMTSRSTHVLLRPDRIHPISICPRI